MLRSSEEILAKLKEIKGITTDAQLAALFKVKPNTISTWRKRGAPYDPIITLCIKEKIPIGWLIAGQLSTEYIASNGRKILTASEGPGECYRQAEVGKIAESSEEEEYISVPQLPDKNDAGAAPFSSHATEIRIAFKKEWISRKGDPSKMALIKISGDSMVPTLLPGDLVLIDHGRNRLDHQGGIYAISVNRQLMIKRLQGEPPLKRIRIISDNPKYSLIEAKRDQVHIKGKVIWFGRDLER